MLVGAEGYRRQMKRKEKGYVIMKKIITTLAMFAALSVVISSTAISQTSYTGVISLDSVQAMPGEHIGVPVWLHDNNFPFSGLIIPLKFSGTDIVADSISFAGTMVGPDFDMYDYIDTLEQVIKISFFPKFVTPIPTVDDTAGLLATIYFTVNPSAIPGNIISIDSIYKDSVVTIDTTQIHVYTRIEATDQSGTQIWLPDYIPGEIIVTSSTSAGEGIDPALPSVFSLGQNFPNPFNPTTTITFALPAAGKVNLKIFNILGQEVMTVIDQQLPAGNHEIEVDASALPSGVYFYRLSYNNQKLTRKMTLIK